jgi:sigma-B regulation protein RsbU (phosphoserine phosphatase)
VTLQASLLPPELPDVPGIDVASLFLPAMAGYAVGGDFYDVFWVAEGKVGMFIGDVSGKGVAAALLMARISSDLRLAAASRPDPGAALALVNQAVLERQRHDSFVTAVFLILDVKTREAVLANAGHPPPIIRRRNRALLHVEGGIGPAIGVFADAQYPLSKVKLAPGEVLVLYTDGVVEATDDHGNQYGFERLETSIVQGGHRPLQIARRLLKDLHEHTGDAQSYDDLTLLVCGVDDTAMSEQFRDNPTPVEAVPPLRTPIGKSK